MKTHSMRRRMTLYLLGIVSLMTVLYGFLMNVYLFNGLEAATSFDMELTAARYAKAYREDPDTPLPRSGFISAYLNRQQLPEKVAQLFPYKVYKDRKLYVSHENPGQPSGKTGGFFILMPYNLPDGNQLLLLKHYDQADKELADPPNIDLLRFMAIPLGISCVLIVALAVRAMFSKLYQPMNALNEWASKLDADSLSRPLPNFDYKEVNQLAALLHNSMKGLSDSLEREQHFVRLASHELRTPLAIIQSNTELLSRMHPDIPEPERIPFDRIRRATFNMNRLTETLLWLCLDDNRIPAPEAVALDVMARELVAENRYLLDGKRVGVELIFEPSQVRTIAHGARIAMGNIIRNSFQYTAEGIVAIAVKNTTITVTNINRTPHQIDTIGSDYGYGLGLILVEQITRKSGWQYSNEVIPGGRRATVVFSSAKARKALDCDDLTIPGFRNILR